jgi:hypothetical protein
MLKIARKWPSVQRAKPTYKRFKRMEQAWLALAEEQDWFMRLTYLIEV